MYKGINLHGLDGMSNERRYVPEALGGVGCSKIFMQKAKNIP